MNTFGAVAFQNMKDTIEVNNKYSGNFHIYILCNGAMKGVPVGVVHINRLASEGVLVSGLLDIPSDRL